MQTDEYNSANHDTGNGGKQRLPNTHEHIGSVPEEEDTRSPDSAKSNAIDRVHTRSPGRRPERSDRDLTRNHR